MSRIKTTLFGLVLLLASAGLFVANFDAVDNLTGLFSVVDIAPEEYSYNVSGEVSMEDAAAALDAANRTIIEMEELNISTSFVRDVLLEAWDHYTR